MKIKLSHKPSPKYTVALMCIACGLLLAVTLLFNACQDQLEDSAQPDGGQKTQITATLFDDQNTEDDHDATIVPFDKDGNYANIPLITADVKDGKLSAPLNPGEYKLVLLANCKDQVNIAPPAMGQSKDDYLKEIQFLPDGQTGKVNPQDIPMWGEWSGTINASNKNMKINMMRMTSRVDLTMASTANLTLTGVWSYNTLANGQVAPYPGSFPGQDSSLPVDKPSLPDNKQMFDSPIKYEAADDIQDNACVGRIFPLETAAAASKSDEDLNKAPFLILKGTYKDAGGKEHTDRYYRVDFFSIDKSTKDTTYMPLLRNHQYKISVLNVNDDGYDTADKAMKSRYGKVNYSVIDWSDPDIHDIVFDGNVLGVNHRVFTAYGDGSLEKGYKDGDHLMVYTDYAKGWTVKSITDDKTKTNADWIKVTPDKGIQIKKLFVNLQCSRWINRRQIRVRLRSC